MAEIEPPLRSLSGTESSRPSASAVHEALGKRGALPSDIKPLNPSWHLSGPARTVRAPAGDNYWLHRGVSSAMPGEVLMVSAEAALRHGYWGELLTRAAMARGLAGLVIDGGVRDGVALVELGWPVFARGLCIQGTTKKPGEPGGIGNPIRVGDVNVYAGDLVVGDADGVVVVPSRDAAATLQGALGREARERRLWSRVASGADTLDLLAKLYEEEKVWGRD